MEGYEIKDYSAIISGIITALSTLAAVFATNYFNLRNIKQNSDIAHERDSRKIKLEKKEEFYLLFERWETYFTSIYLYHLRAYTGDLTYMQVLEATDKKENFISIDAQRLKMLLNIYMSDFVFEYEKVDAARKEIVPYIMRNPEESNLKTKDFIKAQKNFENICKAFKNKLSESVGSL